MDKVFDLNHLSRETVVGQGRPPRTALVIGTTWSSEKSRSAGNRAADTLLSSYRWLPGFSKSSEKRPFAQTGNALDRRECPDSISFPRHSDSEWFIENVTHNGKHPLGRNVFAGAWRRGDPTESQRSATERQGMTSIVPGSNSRPGPRPRE